jgi:transaldolase/glucose-6-phosphate isomerase
VDRPNLMVKIPATKEGIPAIQAAIAAGINVNVTLIFSIERYQAVMDAYIKGLEERIEAGMDVDRIASVASFFVSRMDTKVDGLLDKIDGSRRKDLQGKAAIAYTRLAYAEFLKVFRGKRFAELSSAGCAVQRPLWASTSTKNPHYPDTMYVDELIGPGTVNTVPPQTLIAFRDHGKVKLTIQDNLDKGKKILSEIENLGISMQQVTTELEVEGVKTFSIAFGSMLQAIEERRSAAVLALGPLAIPVRRRIAGMISENYAARLWSHDPTLWTSGMEGQEEIKKRLGWLDLPLTSRTVIKNIQDFSDEIRVEGLNKVLLLGMGGSSLAPEVLSIIHSRLSKGHTGEKENQSSFAILDSTDPDQVRDTAAIFPPEDTLYIVSSKSGGTAEVNALFKYFWQLAEEDGRHFAAITDPGTPLDALANARNFRKTFRADSTIGGRFSVLSHFGLVPAALIGLDGEHLLDRAGWMMQQCGEEISGPRNPALALGAVLGQAALTGRDKLTFLADETVAPLGTWLEQLIAESSGKQGKGIFIVDREPILNVDSYNSDRLFTYLRHDGELDELVENLRLSKQPVLVFNINDIYDLGAEFYRWEAATAFACAILGVNAFDQPDVQDNKSRTSQKILAYNQNGTLDEGEFIWEENGIKAYSTERYEANGLENTLHAFLERAKIGAGRDYVAINAYLPRNLSTTETLTNLRMKVGAATNCVTSLGFGPRFLHSTGQLHKGGPKTGHFLQITTDPENDLNIPGEKMSFGILERCQALGDFEALAARKIPILRLHLASRDLLERVIKAAA